MEQHTFNGFINRSVIEIERFREERRKELDEENLALAIEAGLRSAASATPDLFAGFNRYREAGQILAEWIRGQQ